MCEPRVADHPADEQAGLPCVLEGRVAREKRLSVTLRLIHGHPGGRWPCPLRETRHHSRPRRGETGLGGSGARTLLVGIIEGRLDRSQVADQSLQATYSFATCKPSETCLDPPGPLPPPASPSPSPVAEHEGGKGRYFCGEKKYRGTGIAR